MSLRTQRDDLRRQRDQELRNLHRTYARSKRELKRKLSPDRWIRRHLGASLGLSALAGFLLAPRPGPRQGRPAAAKPHLPAWLTTFIQHNIPQLARFVPGLKGNAKPPANGQPEPPAQPPSYRANPLKLLLTVLFFVLRNGRLRRMLVNAVRRRRRRGAAGNDSAHAGPDVTISNAGAMHDPQLQPPHQS